MVTRVARARRGGGPERPAGALGEVARAPDDATHSYTVRFAEGGEACYRRQELLVHRHLQRQGLDEGAAALEVAGLVPRHVILRVVVGSRAFGLAGEDSDTDRRGVFLPPATMHWSLYGVPEQIESPETEECYWELGKFLRLALKANPNLLECLYTPRVEHADGVGRELLGLRARFLSRLAYQTYQGYALSQFKKIEADLRQRGKVRWKHAMHLLRLLLSGAVLLREERVLVDVGEHRERLLAVKRGEVPWEEVDAWRRRLHAALEAAHQVTRLPERPDYEAVDDFLIRARRSAVTP